MPLELPWKQQPSLAALEALAVFALACDSALGVLVSLAFDLRHFWDTLNAVLFVTAAPLYLVRLKSLRLAIVCLSILFFGRWVVMCFDGSPAGFVNPVAWPLGPFLFAGLILLGVVYFKGRRHAAAAY